MDEHNNIIPFRSPSTTVITIAPPSRTSWSSLDVEEKLLAELHKNLKTPSIAENPFQEIVVKSCEESGVMEILGRHPTHIPKSFGVQIHEIANKLMYFDDPSDPYYGIWYLDDKDEPINLLYAGIDFKEIKDKKMYYLSDIVETLQDVFSGQKINILDYSCSSCLYPNSKVIRNADDRQVRRISRGMASSAKSTKKGGKRKTYRK